MRDNLPFFTFIFLIICLIVSGAYLLSKTTKLSFSFPAHTATPTSTPTPTPFPDLSTVLDDLPTYAPTSTSSPLLSTPRPTRIPTATCTRLVIKSGEFVSQKCYLPRDYQQLREYLNQYESAQFDLRSANGTINITCNCRVQQECDFFRDSCDQAKQKKSAAESSLSYYRGLILSLIARGR